MNLLPGSNGHLWLVNLPDVRPGQKQRVLKNKNHNNWLVLSTHQKNISQIENLPQIGVNIKNIWNHHPDKAL